MPRIRKRRRGIYLLPTLFTIGNLFGGFLALVYTEAGAWTWAALAIVAAGILDGLDGRIARLTGTTSEFGMEFDSLADVVSFGVAPAYLILHWGLDSLGRGGWLLAFLYLVAAATRLARFNIQSVRATSRYFAGLPSPPAGGTLAAIVLAVPEPQPGPSLALAAALALLAMAALMLSHLRYRSFKEIDLRDRRSTLLVLPLAAMVTLVWLQPTWALLAMAACYVLSAPLDALIAKLRRGGREEVGDESLRGIRR